MTTLDGSAMDALLQQFGQRSALRGGNPFRAKAYGARPTIVAFAQQGSLRQCATASPRKPEREIRFFGWPAVSSISCKAYLRIEHAEFY